MFGQSGLFNSLILKHLGDPKSSLKPPSMLSSARTPASTSASAPTSTRSDGSDEESKLPSSNFPRRACEKCTRSKRKCDKSSPTCGRCKRLGARCNYNYDTSTRTSSVDEVRPRDHPGFIREVGSIASLLTAVNSFGEQQTPSITQLLVESHIDWKQTRDVDYHAIHRWFSLYNWDKIETTFGVENNVDETPFEQLQVPAADAALLLVCIYLSSQYVGPHKPDSPIPHPLYQSARRTFSLLKCLMQPTLELMQCGALIALIEYGHGLFITAHATLSETVAMARIFDLSPGKYIEEDAWKSWTSEEEETCALWWYLFELEQLIRQDPTAKQLPSIMPAPAPDDLLPPDRTGDPSCPASTPFRLPQSAPTQITVGSRRRSAQSAVVLYHALLWESRWIYRDNAGIVRPMKSVTSSYHDMEIDPTLTSYYNDRCPVSLARDQAAEVIDASSRAVLQAMVNQTDQWEIFCDCFSMCLSAMYILYVPCLPSIEHGLTRLSPHDISTLLAPSSASEPTTTYLFPATDSPPRLTKERKALTALNFSARFVSDLSMAFNKGLEEDASKLTETVVAPAIQTCAISLEVFLRLGDVIPDAKERFESIWRSVLWFSTRWGLGDVVQRRVSSVRPRRGGIVVPDVSDHVEAEEKARAVRRKRSGGS